ncbi:hypothetical protein CDL15_Pgr012156 [Punica granatum]|nr:hypothetical protein CDL15_Pgr012156 [Punica granatum]
MKKCAAVNETILAAVYKALNDHCVLLEGTLLKPNMGGQTKEEATVNLYAMNKLEVLKPWMLSFSSGRALQHCTLQTWAGKKENVAKAQEAFLFRCKANSDATLGKYIAGSSGELALESLYVKGYKY